MMDAEKDVKDRTAFEAAADDSEPGEELFEDGAVDPVYRAKAHVLNAAIAEIGMGRYQVRSGFTANRAGMLTLSSGISS